MIEMRSANLEDASDIARIHVSCWRDVYPFMPEEVHTARGYEMRLKQWTELLSNPNPNTQILVVDDEGTTIGFTMVKENEDPAIPEARGELHAAYFLPEYRGMPSGSTP